VAEGSTVQPFGGGAYIPDPLAQFLSRVVPWGHGFVGLHAFTPKYIKDRQYRRGGGGEAYASMDEYGQMQQYVALINRDGDEVFVCMSSRDGFKEEVVRASGRRVRKADRNHRKTAPVALKAVWLDIDVPKNYPTQEAALAALRAFCAELGLTPGFIVNSGGGIHVYFVLDVPVAPEVWRPLAGRLVAAAQAKNLKIDKVTTDDERVMRLPTSINQKEEGNPRLVTIIEQGPDMTLAALEAALAPYPPLVTPGVRNSPSSTGTVVLDPAIFPRRAPITSGPDFDRVSAEREKLKVATSIDLLQQACPVVADSFARGGDGDPEPLWFELAKLSHYVENGRDFFHDLSSDDARYDEQATDRKYDQAQGLGWPQCVTIASACPAAAAICQRCAFHGKGKSPINHAVMGLLGTTGAAMPMQQTIQPQAVQVNGHVNGYAAPPPAPTASQGIAMPPGYKLNANGYICLDDDRRVFSTKLYNIDLKFRQSGDGLLSQKFYLTVPLGTNDRKIQTVEIGAGSLSNAATAAKAFQEGGIWFDDFNRMKAFMTDWQTMVREAMTATTEARFGWVKEDGIITGFSYGGVVYDQNGASPSGSSDPNYTPRGSLAAWKDAANIFVGKGCIEMETLMAGAFAAPLVEFTSVSGVVVFGRTAGSGYGKSASLETAASVWGDRTSTVITDGTQNATMDSIFSANNLPVIYDEFVPATRNISAAARRFAELVVQISSGREKRALTRGRQQMPRRTSRTMLLAAANASLSEAASGNDSDAQAVRVFEFEMSDAVRRIVRLPSETAAARLAMDQNFGRAGEKYAAFLGKNHEHVRQMVSEMEDWFFAQVSGTGTDRFWQSAAATLYVGATISKKLGLIDFDILSMRKFLVEQIRKQRSAVEDMSVDADNPDIQLSRVRDFINGNLQGRIITETVPQRGWNKTMLETADREPDLIRSREIVCRIAKKSMVMWVSEGRLRQYCIQHDINYQQMRRTLEKAQYCRRSGKHPKSLGIGTRINVAKESILEFDLNMPANSIFIPDDGV
jgi:hypothetical protein